MPATRRSATAAGMPGGDGSDGGKCGGEEGSGRSKGPPASPNKRGKVSLGGNGSDGGDDSPGRIKRPSASPLASPNKRGKAEASEPKENALAAAKRNSSGRSEGKEMGKSGGTHFKYADKDNQGVKESALGNQCDPIKGSIPLSVWQAFKDGLKQGILNPDDIEVTLDSSPYYVSGTANEILLSSALMHMEKEFRNRFEKISSLNRRILISGPSGSELYQEALVKALAKHFDARLLILDSLVLGGDSLKELRKDDAPTGADIVGLSNKNTFGEVFYAALGNLIIEVISEESCCSKLIVLLKDAHMLLTEYREWLRRELPICVLIIGCQTQGDKDQEASGSQPKLFPHKICIELPQNKEQLSDVRKQLEHDIQILKTKAIVANIDEGCSAERMRAIQAVFPAAPDVMVLYPNQFLDLWACGQAVEEPWAEVWRRLPLVLHDVQLSEAVQINLQAEHYDDIVIKRHDFSETISKVLRKHPGPIKCVRLDSTACPGPGLLSEWVDMLSAKAVQELVLVNLTWPMEQLEFPLHRLCSQRLVTLALGFFGLTVLGLDLCYTLLSLEQLILVGCRFSGQALSAVLYYLTRLSSLTIGSCDITAGCGHQGLEIESRTLTRLHLCKCTASAVTIVNAPALQVLITGVTSAPAPGRRETLVLINLRSADELQTLEHLGLHLHRLQITSDATVKLKHRPVVSLPALKTLSIGIQVCMPHHASILVDLLGSLPRLQKLTLWRVDDLPTSGDDETCRKAWSLDCAPPCITHCLENLVVQEYRGGGGEVAFVRRVLSIGCSLVSVTLCLHQTVPLEVATTPFGGCLVASNGCKIVVRRATHGVYE
ncbi:uncharacterized protein [Setaria viridis]|uniref:F-box/LRR-repeat protein 15/At3g58940/PEG3-like LRR domain-containing protein n=1 Tax=Setaria viridis TaxID=4556 RepID=A0A4U6WFZ2_SETVI|nr:uncharacterized protein LOC117860601 isoform X2 [Setaria viridis]TKW40139.1 hypothetical protein SEVIR_1G226700v2 [Setaria viridis]